MDENKLEKFENKTIRTAWDEEKEEWYFSIEDVVSALTDSTDPKQYIKKLRSRDSELGSKWGTICTPVEMIAADGKRRKIQAADTEGVLRLVQSIPSKKAEPFKMWLAEATTTELTKTQNPSGLEENRAVAKAGGGIAGDVRKSIEKKTGKPVVTSANAAQLNDIVTGMIEAVAESTVKKVLFFDVGYTLINEDAVWERRCREQAETEEAKRRGLSAEDIYNEICLSSVNRKPQWRTVVNKYSFKEIAPYRFELEYLYEDAPPVLKALSEKYELGIIANQADGLKNRLSDLGILPYFKYVISSWDVGIMKPDRKIFEYALKTADCPPENAFMIGDRLDNDIAPAKSVGMKTVWIRQGFGRLQTPLSEEDTPDYTVDRLRELLNFLY